MKHEDLIGIIEAKYDRYARLVIDAVSALPCRRGERNRESNAWEDWCAEQTQRIGSESMEHSAVIQNACLKIAGALPDDELALLWLTSKDYEVCAGLDAIRAQGESLKRVVAGELYRRICRSVLAPRVSLHHFIIQLVNDWDCERAQEPALVSTPAEVTRLIWGGEDADLGTSLDDDADSTKIANVIEAGVKERFGDYKWYEMSDYINQATPEQREEMNLRDFSHIFHDVLQGYRRPKQPVG